MLDFTNYHIPERMQGRIIKYVKDKIPPGDFLQAVLENDLKEACGRADLENQLLIFEYCKFLYNEVPSICWGSVEAYENWLERKKDESHG